MGIKWHTTTLVSVLWFGLLSTDALAQTPAQPSPTGTAMLKQLANRYRQRTSNLWTKRTVRMSAPVRRLKIFTVHKTLNAYDANARLNSRQPVTLTPVVTSSRYSELRGRFVFKDRKLKGQASTVRSHRELKDWYGLTGQALLQTD